MEDSSHKRTLKITTSEQFELLCKEVKEHPEIALNKPVFGGSKAKVEMIWADIALKLNGLGPPQREVAEWKKVWTELKSRTKKKLSENHQSLKTTGGGPYQYEDLSPVEEMVDQVINIRAAALPPGNAVGVANIPSTSSKHDIEQPKSKKRPADSTSDLLREQVNNQKYVIKLLSDLNTTQTKIAEALKQQADCTEKLAKVAENFFKYLSSD